MNDHRVRSIVKSLSNIKSDNFFNDICMSLSRAIDADFVFIAMLDPDKTQATSIAVSHKGLIVDNFSYSLEFTPCAEVSDGSICTHRKNIQQHYPDDQLLVDMGISGYVGIPLKTNEGDSNAILVALFEEEITNTQEIESLFLLFSGLIEKELHKLNYLKEIEFSKKIIESTHEAILVCDKNKLITYINPSFTRLTGYTNADVKNKTPSLLTSSKQNKDFNDAIWKSIDQNGHWQGEIWSIRKNGTDYLQWTSITAIFDEHYELTHYNAFFYDITERHKANEKIKFQSSYDSLTKIANKNKLFSFIEKSIKQYEYQVDNSVSAALIVIDIDYFKKFNSLHSHSFGDKVLIHVANTLNALTNENDIVARTSGDNFALFTNHIKGESSVINLINKINKSINEPFIIDGVTIKITLCMGISYLGLHAKDAHSFFEKAEQAMFSSKKNGRNSHGFYNRQISEKANQEEQLKLSLERAIEHDEFTLVYQPIISLKKHTITKFEALIRWSNNGNVVSPAEFIPAAEKFGLITKIGNIVLDKACRQLALLKKQGLTNVMFNINRSIHEFPVDNYDNSWINTIKQHGINPKQICFELTESVLAPENNNYIALLNKLQQAGCTIALDDFGTGYSSLSYLRRFPIDTLKIDRSFITEMANVAGDVVLVSAIISMAKALDISVVAEGVEHKEEVDILTKLNCDYIQGYYYSKPLLPETLPNYLFDLKESLAIA